MARLLIVIIVVYGFTAEYIESLGVPALFIGKTIIYSFVSLSVPLFVVAALYKCPSCSKRPFINWGNSEEIRISPPGMLRYFGWLIPGELFVKQFYCCRCHDIIKVK